MAAPKISGPAVRPNTSNAGHLTSLWGKGGRREVWGVRLPCVPSNYSLWGKGGRRKVLRWRPPAENSKFFTRVLKSGGSGTVPASPNIGVIGTPRSSFNYAYAQEYFYQKLLRPDKAKWLTTDLVFLTHRVVRIRIVLYKCSPRSKPSNDNCVLILLVSHADYVGWRGYVVWYRMSVCLSVCPQHNSKTNDPKGSSLV